jgi:hypothetical protein
MIRVDVVTHLNEDSFSYGLAHGLADRLRTALREVRCDDHQDQGVVRVSTSGVAQVVNDLQVEISGCCPEVAERVEAIVAAVSGRQTEEE